MNLQIVDISQANFDDLFDWSGQAQGWDAGCKYCLYWEQPDSAKWPETLAGRADAKRQWFRDVEAEFGPCGKLAFAGAKLVGYSQFCAPKYLPRVGVYACAPPSEDAVFVSCLFVAADARNQGVGSALLGEVVSDLSARPASAVETFARRSSPNNCSGPLEFWLKHGFHIVREADDFALVRRELS
jgi:ribosomal protein S18 acetylase RimI-like enzyme